MPDVMRPVGTPGEQDQSFIEGPVSQAGADADAKSAAYEAYMGKSGDHLLAKVAAANVNGEYGVLNGADPAVLFDGHAGVAPSRALNGHGAQHGE